MAKYELYQEQWVGTGRGEVSRYFETPENLQELTPPFLNFRVRSSGPFTMAVGLLIEYTISLYGVPMRWLTRIDEFVAGERFVDFQLQGPYRTWRHLHTFEDRDGGTFLTDRVVFELPLGPLGDLAFRLFVRRNLDTIFRFRAQKIAALFGGGARANAASVPKFRAV